jgi:hypothetical protein
VNAGPALVMSGALVSAAAMGLALARLAPVVPAGAPLVRALADVLDLLEDSRISRPASALLGPGYRAHARSRMGPGRTIAIEPPEE